MPVCPECNGELPEGAKEGLCPKCLMVQGLKIVSALASPVPGPPRSDLPRNFGDYELLEEIARGGMGIVYKARQRSLDRIVAVKTLLLSAHASPEFVKRFRAEASAAASLRHPNIVAIHEVGMHQDEHYLVMDYVAGPSLAKFIKGKPLPVRHAASHLKTIAEAIHYAHERGILHRDLKPSNVLIGSNDEPLVTDFGLAKRLGSDSQLSTQDSQLTVSGQVVGSPGYMPPEQAAGTRGKVGRRGDVYSLGAMLYHLLTDRPPFVGETLNEILDQVFNREPLSPRLLNPAVPRDLETICLKCLEKEPQKRYATAQEFADELGRFLRGEPIHARPVSAPEKLWRWCRRKPALAGALATALLLLLVVAIGAPVLAVRIDAARDAERSERLRKERNLYASNMKLAFNALELNNRGRVLALLQEHTPKKPGDTGLRGWEWRYLWKQTRSDELFSLPESKHEIQCLTFSADGKYLATAEARGRISIWDLTTTQRVAECQSPLIPGLLQFSSDTRHLANVNYNNGLWLWDWNPPHLTNHGPPLIAKGLVSGLDLRDGILAAVDRDRKLLRRWELTTGRELPGFPIASESYWSVFSPDGRLIATSSNSIVTLWNRQTGAVLKELPGSDSTSDPLAFSPDSRLIIAGGGNGRCDVWETGTFRKVASFDAHDSLVDKGKFSPDGRQFVTAGYDHTLKVWDTSDWPKPANEWRKSVTLRGHLGEVYDAAFSPDGRLIASASADGTVKFWSASSKPREENFKLLPRGVRSKSLSPGGQWLFLIFSDDTFSLWDLNTGDESQRHPLPSGRINIAALFPDGRRVALGGADGAVKLFDFATMAITAAPMQTRFSNAVLKVSCSADGSTIVAQSTNDEIKAWHVPSGREFATLSAENNTELDRLPVSPDGRFVVTAPLDGTTEIWELSGLNKRTLSSDKLFTTGAAFFQDGRVATCSHDKTAQVWDLTTRRSLLTMHSDQTGLRSIALSPDERRLAAGDELGRIKKVKVWDLATGQEVAVLSGHKLRITEVAFWPDGNTIVSVSQDAVFVWRGASFEEIEADEKRQAAAR